MSLAPSKRPPSAEPSFDLDYSIDDFEVDPHADSQFLYKRVEEAMLDEACVPGGRSLDVACGAGQLAVAIHERGGEGWGLEPSNEMLGISRWLFPADKAVLVRGLAEHLPFRAGSFDRVTCQGSLDHFVDPQAFMREAARLVKPDGYVIVALANYESLSCRIGRLWQRLDRDVLGRRPPPHRKYWEIPADHFHRGEVQFVRGLGEATLRLERCYGVSLLWLFRGTGQWTWGRWLDRRPRPLARAILTALDRIAFRVPSLADMIISVWQPSKERNGRA